MKIFWDVMIILEDQLGQNLSILVQRDWKQTESESSQVQKLRERL